MKLRWSLMVVFILLFIIGGYLLGASLANESMKNLDGSKVVKNSEPVVAEAVAQDNVELTETPKEELADFSDVANVELPVPVPLESGNIETTSEGEEVFLSL